MLQQFLFPFDVIAIINEVRYDVVKVAVIEAAVLLRPT